MKNQKPNSLPAKNQVPALGAIDNYFQKKIN